MTERSPSVSGHKRRRIREGLANRWHDANLQEICTDQVLERLVSARNTSSATANKFMLFGALAAFLYLLKLEGIANELKLADYSLVNLPFGLFTISASGLVLATVALVRIGDSRGFDRHLRFACENLYASESDGYYASFPNPTAFGESFSIISSTISPGILMTIVRSTALFLITIFTIALICAPAITGIHYLGSGIYATEGGYTTLRWWLVFILILTNISALLLVIWVRLADEG